MRCALDHMVAKGFVPLSVPTLVRSEVMVGTGYFPGGEEQAYRTDARDDLCLVGHGRGAGDGPATRARSCAHTELPKLYVAHSSLLPARGRDLRQGHARALPRAPVPEGRAGGHRRRRRSREPSRTTTRSWPTPRRCCRRSSCRYRVVNVCGGDLGVPQVQKFDIETWMPSRKAYGETHSASRFHDFQARRLEPALPRTRTGRPRFCHTLNNTVVRQRAHADRAAREPPAGRRPRAPARGAAALPRRSRGPRAPAGVGEPPAARDRSTTRRLRGHRPRALAARWRASRRSLHRPGCGSESRLPSCRRLGLGASASGIRGITTG